tara:strand:- start:166 stop:687 length:522 start_codon:yes stop_codon:yes gene_type:complete
MTKLKNSIFVKKFSSLLPIILLYSSVLNNFDFNYLELKYFSFNFAYIIIFYYSLRKSLSLGYIYIFIAGLFNDVVIGTPIGLSSLSYLLLCGAAAYLRNITLSPSLIKDWIFFLLTILILNSLGFIVLTLIFNYEFNYIDQLINVIFTFLFYLIFSHLFNFLDKFLLGNSNVG